MRARPALLAAVLILAACDQPQTEAARRRRATETKRYAKTDSVIPPDPVIPFVIPATWDSVRLPTSGVTFHEPPGFLTVNDATVGGCNAGTQSVEVPLLATSLLDRWPLTVGMRRGDLNRLARANGFVLDSTIISTIGQRETDSTRVRRGEGWLVMNGRAMSNDTPINVLFAAVRYPGGCFLTFAARGVDINIDTLGYVLGTVRFPPAAP